jgi:hypothetical protein
MDNQNIDLRFKNRTYTVLISHTLQHDFMHIFKLIIGQTRYWIVYNGDTWKFYSDISPCDELKKVIINQLQTIVQSSTIGINTAGLVKLSKR